MDYQEFFKGISIRGRFAFGALCIENAFEKERIAGDVPKQLLTEIWQYTATDRLDNWEERINNIAPVCLLDDKFDINTFNSFTPIQILQFKAFFESLPAYIVDIVDFTIEIGVSNIYGGTGAYSETTLGHLMQVVNVASLHDVRIPDHNLFHQFPFSEVHGWGRRFTRGELLRY
jgi:hypothetical protein